jgi:hypothetical protein
MGIGAAGLTQPGNRANMARFFITAIKVAAQIAGTQDISPDS